MSQEIRAIYENGLFRPLDPVALDEHDMVSLVVSTPPNRTHMPAREDKDLCEAAVIDFDGELESLLFDGPSLPDDFSRADIYADHD